MEAYRVQNRRKIREDLAKNHAPAEFDEEILMDRLIYSQPLQRVYEIVYFDNFDLIPAF